MKKTYITFLSILDSILYLTSFITFYNVLFSGIIQGKVVIEYSILCVILFFLLSCFSNFILKIIVDYKMNKEVLFNKDFFIIWIYNIFTDIIFYAILLFLIIKFDTVVAYLPIMFKKFHTFNKIFFSISYFILSFWISIGNLKFWLKKEPD